MEHRIDRIIQMEFAMMDAVQNIDGRSSCQDDDRTFKIMRESQFRSWDDQTLERYEQDLVKPRS